MTAQAPEKQAILKHAVVTGFRGQDAGLLIPRLLERGYRITATTRDLRGEPPTGDTALRTAMERGQLALETLDLQDHNDCRRVVESAQPDELYHLAGPSHVLVCEDDPRTAIDVIAVGTARLLDAVRDQAPACRFFFASSSEVFRAASVSPQTEQTPLAAGNVYGAAKLSAQAIVRQARQQHDLFACSGILYNHESSRRPERFVTRKITAAAARIARGRQQRLRLGNIDSQRDWSYAGDVVEAMWLMLQAEVPRDYVVASGVSRPVSDWLDVAFAHVGLNWRDHVDFEPSLVRKEENSQQLVGNSAAIHRDLQWRATLGFEDLVRQMVDSDLQQVDGGTGFA